MRKSRDDRVAEIIERGWDIPTRTIYLHGDIDDAMAHRFLVAVAALDKKHDPIHVSLSSCGGDIDSGLTIYDAIRSTESPVIIVGTGRIRSMAGVILQAGDQRLLTPGAFLMLHDGHIVIAEAGALQARDAGRMLREIKTMDKYCDKLVMERSGISAKTLRRLSRNEIDLSAPEALKLGLIDAVVEPRPFPEVKRGTSSNGG